MQYDMDLKVKLAAKLIAKFEGFSPRIYDDGVGYMTIGYGHLIKPGDPYNHNTYLSEDEGLDLLEHDLNNVRDALIKFPYLNYGQYAASASLLFNIGTKGFIGKGPAPSIKALFERLNSSMKDDPTGKSSSVFVPALFESFCTWRRAASKILPGLIKRRFAEAMICCGRYDFEYPSTMFKVNPSVMPIANANWGLIEDAMKDEAALIAKEFLSNQ